MHRYAGRSFFGYCPTTDLLTPEAMPLRHAEGSIWGLLPPQGRAETTSPTLNVKGIIN